MTTRSREISYLLLVNNQRKNLFLKRLTLQRKFYINSHALAATTNDEKSYSTP